MMDIKKKVEEVDKRFKQLKEQRELLLRQIEQVNAELLRLQGEYRLLLKLREENNGSSNNQKR